MIDTLMQRDMHHVLLANDQLKIEQASGQVFDEFEEGPLNFRPSYKFDRGTDQYDTSKKRRIPSWTDRILYRSNTNAQAIQLLKYDSFSRIKTSDHRPVYAVFDVNFNPSIHSSTIDESSPPLKTQTRSEVCVIQ